MSVEAQGPDREVRGFRISDLVWPGAPTVGGVGYLFGQMLDLAAHFCIQGTLEGFW